MQLSKLAEAFENQFFASIEQMDALDYSITNGRNSSSVVMSLADRLPALDENGKTKRIFENMTIYKQYVEYHALKSSLHDSLKSVNRLSKVIMSIGVTYLLFLTVSCFIG